MPPAASAAIGRAIPANCGAIILTAIRSKDAPDIIMPNPLQLDQAHAGIVWREFLLTLTKKQHTEIYQVVSCVKDVTYEFDEWVDRD